MTTDVGAVADELYALPAREFTGARDRAAAEARRAGAREVAATIKKLRRPTVSAWCANQLVRQRAEEVTRLLEVGADLRRAQASLDADELRRLTQEGQRLVTDLARQAGQIAVDGGQALSEAAAREVEATLHAALADPVAADAVRSGRLTAPLHYSGFGLVDLTGAVAAPAPSSPARVRPEPEPASEAAAPEVDGAGQAIEDAEAEVAAAERQAGDGQKRAEQARDRQEALRRRISQLDEEREQLRAEEIRVGEEVRTAARVRGEAERRLARAQAALLRLQDNR